MGVGGQPHAPAALPPGKTRYPLYRRLGGPQGRSGQVRKISSLPGFDPRSVQPVASHCTNWAINVLWVVLFIFIWPYGKSFFIYDSFVSGTQLGRKTRTGVHTEFQFLPLIEHFMYCKARLLMLLAVGFTPNTYTMQSFVMLTTGVVVTGAYVSRTIWL
jgi:hypothetical protein